MSQVRCAALRCTGQGEGSRGCGAGARWLSRATGCCLHGRSSLAWPALAQPMCAAVGPAGVFELKRPALRTCAHAGNPALKMDQQGLLGEEGSAAAQQPQPPSPRPAAAASTSGRPPAGAPGAGMGAVDNDTLARLGVGSIDSQDGPAAGGAQQLQKPHKPHHHGHHHKQSGQRPMAPAGAGAGAAAAGGGAVSAEQAGRGAKQG